MNSTPYLPIEPTLNEFVEKFGGELAEKLPPRQRKGEGRADYLFRAPSLIAELKCMQQEVYTPAYHAKVQARSADWRRRGLIPHFYGTALLRVEDVPAQCQSEWLGIIERPMNKNIVTEANEQIRDTKAALGLPNARGVLLLANEGIRSLRPADIFILLNRILCRKKDDGSPRCSSIDWIVLFSTNVAVMNAGDPRPMTFWKAAYRFGPDASVSRFLTEMSLAWNRHCAEKRGVPLKEVDVSQVDFESVRFV